MNKLMYIAVCTCLTFSSINSVQGCHMGPSGPIKEQLAEEWSRDVRLTESQITEAAAFEYEHLIENLNDNGQVGDGFDIYCDTYWGIRIMRPVYSALMNLTHKEVDFSYLVGALKATDLTIGDLLKKVEDQKRFAKETQRDIHNTWICIYFLCRLAEGKDISSARLSHIQGAQGYDTHYGSRTIRGVIKHLLSRPNVIPANAQYVELKMPAQQNITSATTKKKKDRVRGKK